MCSWSKYFEHHKQSSHHELLERAIAFQTNIFTTKDQKYALDIGCGTGRDTIFLLQNKYETTSIDPEKEALDITVERCKKLDLPSPEIFQSKLENLILTREYDLITANLSLPFVYPENFNACWEKIVSHLKAGGVFSGQFFGIKHGWANKPKLTILEYKQIHELFSFYFDIKEFEETLELVQTVSHGEQEWHQWNVIAVKLNTPLL